MFGFGIWEVLLVLAIFILFFGGKKIPEVARGLGSAIRNFKGSLKEGEAETKDEGDERELPRSGDRDDA